MKTAWDGVVVGGGAAGLSAALVQGRARQRTLLIDADAQSNLAADGIGGLLRQDGRSPAAFYKAGRGVSGDWIAASNPRRTGAGALSAWGPQSASHTQVSRRTGISSHRVARADRAARDTWWTVAAAPTGYVVVGPDYYVWYTPTSWYSLRTTLIVPGK